MAELPIAADRSGALLYFTDGSLAYAGHYLHEHTHAVHTHAFMEIAVMIGGEGEHVSLAGRKQLKIGDVILLRPGVWHGYENCRRLDLYNCCFSTELLQRELAWTREDPLLGYLLWTGPHSLQRRGMLTTSLDQRSAQRMRRPPRRPGRSSLPAGRPTSGRHHRPALAVPQQHRPFRRARQRPPGRADRPHPSRGGPRDAADGVTAGPPWTLTELGDLAAPDAGYLVRLFKSVHRPAADGLPVPPTGGGRRIDAAAHRPAHHPYRTSVGWPDQNYFARRFKAHYGLSATTYRERFTDTAARMRTWSPDDADALK